MKFSQVLLFAPAYLGLFWLLSSTGERNRIQDMLAAAGGIAWAVFEGVRAL